jgi:glutamate synthase (NADPH/NADH) small chain
LIPETNDLLFRRRLDDAAGRLGLTNPFPEFTGRVCPSPCETACNLGLHENAVTIHDNERAISDYQWERGMKPLPAAAPDAPLVSVIGSGPAGLAAAWELARRGLRVRVYERDGRPGGLLMYGIPNMKLPKWIVERRVALMEKSGIEFLCGVDAAEHAAEIAEGSEAVVLACGAKAARAVNVPGAGLQGVHFAVEYLTEATCALLEERAAAITAADKDVVVVGGGDTGVDCVATALRQGARSVRQVVRAACPPEEIDVASVWPGPRNVYAQAYGQREAADLLGEDPRMWSTDTVGFADDGSGRVSGVQTRPIGDDAAEIEELPAQLVLIAKGFTGAEGKPPSMHLRHSTTCTLPAMPAWVPRLWPAPCTTPCRLPRPSPTSFCKKDQLGTVPFLVEKGQKGTDLLHISEKRQPEAGFLAISRAARNQRRIVRRRPFEQSRRIVQISDAWTIRAVIESCSRLARNKRASMAATVLFRRSVPFWLEKTKKGLSPIGL